MSELKKVYSLDTCTIDVYLQKSQKFLFPLLKISSKERFQPVQTYLSWKDELTRAQQKLICVYLLQESPEFKLFEKSVLYKNELFEDFREAEENQGVYIFNMDKFKPDMEHFMNGKYSRFSELHKKTLLDFYVLNRYSKEYVNSFLYPEKHYEVYAKLLNVDIKLLESVGELCDPPNFKKEQLLIKAIQTTLLT